MPRKEDASLDDFVASFREMQHYLLNSVAIWTSQAEMAGRHPEFHEKLEKSILERADKLTELARQTEAKLAALKPSGGMGTRPPAP